MKQFSIKKWWVLRHIQSQEMHAVQLVTFCGIPICFYFYTAIGPFPDEETAKRYVQGQELSCLNND